MQNNYGDKVLATSKDMIAAGILLQKLIISQSIAYSSILVAKV